jgi:hypothetical protein
MHADGHDFNYKVWSLNLENSANKFQMDQTPRLNIHILIRKFGLTNPPATARMKLNDATFILSAPIFCTCNEKSTPNIVPAFFKMKETVCASFLSPRIKWKANRFYNWNLSDSPAQLCVDLLGIGKWHISSLKTYI